MVGKWAKGFPSTTARSLQLPATEDSVFGQSVTGYYYPPTTAYPSLPSYPTTQKTTPKPIKSFLNNGLQYTSKTRKPSISVPVWPSSSLPSPKYSFRNVRGKNKTRFRGRNRFRNNFTSQRKRKNKTRLRKKRKNKYRKGAYKLKKYNKNSNRIVPSAAKYPKQKRRKPFNSKLWRGSPFQRTSLPKPYPDHMKHSLLVLMPDGPRIPLLETIGNTIEK